MDLRFATEGTCGFHNDHGIESRLIKKVFEGRSNIVDAIKNGEVQLVINTLADKMNEFDDSYIRKIAIKYRIQYIATKDTALAAIIEIKARWNGTYSIKSHYRNITLELNDKRDGRIDTLHLWIEELCKCSIA